ncbi:hypothetical protein Pan97_41030 [Bremerella volcania]|uniref:HTTM-like domain-containing protein n=1 Tax=Bremerella volcania TaxID=2527984 RepID=A0A518CCU1_9BACT|nr:hypothetical protein [Bremerella volcania]QDU77043.1 hypothetical protein Pan97_41030 [Bremerella volcania]
MLGTYFSQFTDTISSGWNQFWFQRDSPKTVSCLRIVAGVVALIYALTFTSELAIWFADGGVLPLDRTYRLTGASDPTVRVYYWSIFYLAHSSMQLYALHVVGLISILLFAVGFQTRITSVIATLFVLSYAERAPMLMGVLEPLLCPVMIYLCLAPCGAYFSVDAWLRARKGDTEEVPPSFTAHLATRLIQVHVVAFYWMMAFAKLGNPVWWNGEAMWWLIAQPDNRLIDLTFLGGSQGSRLLVFGWTHLVVFFELAFGLLIWFRIWRPLLAVLAVFHWVGLGLVTGHWEFAILMIGLTLAFAPWETLEIASKETSSSPQQETATPEPASAGA